MPDPTLDILVSRVLDGCATPADWGRLERLAEQDAGVWRELALAQRADQSLRSAVNSAIDAAGVHELSDNDLRAGAVSRGEGLVARRSRGLAAWGGWAAAALVALAFVARTREVSGPASPVAGLSAPVASAADAFRAYLDKGREQGRVYGELPEKVLVDTVPAADGNGYEVVYIRQILERTHVPAMYELRVTHDEFGRPLPSPVRVVPASEVQRRAWE
jgi:hypothetical protein